jgi:hypothetical protein
MTIEEREKRTILTIADKIEHQAECLEGYAGSHGFEAKPVPSVFHLQASHFRTYADEIREVLGAKV